MKNSMLIAFYKFLPKSIINFLGKSKIFKPLRSRLLYSKEGKFRSTKVQIRRNYSSYNIDFYFYASIKTAAKAKTKGIENTLLNNSFHLIKDKQKKDDAIILDIGANFGYLSMVWAESICKDGGHVYSFEPNLLVNSTFRKSITHNGFSKSITLEQKGVGIFTGEADFYVQGTSSNLQSLEAAKIQKGQVVRINDYMAEQGINKCDLVKIDVDGVELDVLKGATELINKFHPLFIIETNNDHSIIDFMLDRNYKIFDMKLNEYLKGEPIPCNIFCI